MRVELAESGQCFHGQYRILELPVMTLQMTRGTIIIFSIRMYSSPGMPVTMTTVYITFSGRIYMYGSRSVHADKTEHSHISRHEHLTQASAALKCFLQGSVTGTKFW